MSARSFIDVNCNKSKVFHVVGNSTSTKSNNLGRNIAATCTIIYRCALFFVGLVPISVNCALYTKLNISLMYFFRQKKSKEKKKQETVKIYVCHNCTFCFSFFSAVGNCLFHIFCFHTCIYFEF